MSADRSKKPSRRDMLEAVGKLSPRPSSKPPEQEPRPSSLGAAAVRKEQPIEPPYEEAAPAAAESTRPAEASLSPSETENIEELTRHFKASVTALKERGLGDVNARLRLAQKIRELAASPVGKAESERVRRLHLLLQKVALKHGEGQGDKSEADVQRIAEEIEAMFTERSRPEDPPAPSPSVMTYTRPETEGGGAPVAEAAPVPLSSEAPRSSSLPDTPNLDAFMPKPETAESDEDLEAWKEAQRTKIREVAYASDANALSYVDVIHKATMFEKMLNTPQMSDQAVRARFEEILDAFVLDPEKPLDIESRLTTATPPVVPEPAPVAPAIEVPVEPATEPEHLPSDPGGARGRALAAAREQRRIEKEYLAALEQHHKLGARVARVFSRASKELPDDLKEKKAAATAAARATREAMVALWQERGGGRAESSTDAASRERRHDELVFRRTIARPIQTEQLVQKRMLTPKQQSAFRGALSWYSKQPIAVKASLGGVIVTGAALGGGAGVAAALLAGGGRAALGAIGLMAGSAVGVNAANRKREKWNPVIEKDAATLRETQKTGSQGLMQTGTVAPDAVEAVTKQTSKLLDDQKRQKREMRNAALMTGGVVGLATGAGLRGAFEGVATIPTSIPASSVPPLAEAGTPEVFPPPDTAGTPPENVTPPVPPGESVFEPVVPLSPEQFGEEHFGAEHPTTPAPPVPSPVPPASPALAPEPVIASAPPVPTPEPVLTPTPTPLITPEPLPVVEPAPPPEPAPTPEPITPTEPPPVLDVPPVAEPERYTVARGDNLWDILEGDVRGREMSPVLAEIAQANRNDALTALFERVDNDPALREEIGMKSAKAGTIYIGEELNITALEEALREVAEEKGYLTVSAPEVAGVEPEPTIERPPLEVAAESVPLTEPTLEESPEAAETRRTVASVPPEEVNARVGGYFREFGINAEPTGWLSRTFFGSEPNLYQIVTEGNMTVGEVRELAGLQQTDPELFTERARALEISDSNQEKFAALVNDFGRLASITPPANDNIPYAEYLRNAAAQSIVDEGRAAA